jgi:hypothetical protein
MTLPISTVHCPDTFGIKLHIPGRGDNDLIEIWISRLPGERRSLVLVCNGYEEVGSHWIDD